jgi:RNA 2',3'-cyclic 3'-phosphodiesterase
VPKQRLKSPRARLFVALDLPESVRGALAAWQERELTDPTLRPVPAKSLHVTLCFIGWAPERRIEEYADALGAIPARTVPIRLEAQPKGLPPRRPRLYAIDAPSEAATKLAAEVVEALVSRRLHEPEKREFWSHVTVARVRTKKGTGAVERAPGPLSAEACRPFEAVRLTFYRSNLSSHGAEYVPLASTDLSPA